MPRITILGGTGYAGSAIAYEAQKRGHHVTVYSRHAPVDPLAGVTYVTGSVLDHSYLVSAVDDTDVVFETISPRGNMAGKLEAVVDELMKLADEASVRFGVLGGASSLLVSPDGPRLFDTTQFAAENLPEVNTGIALLDALREGPQTLDWFYISPAAGFGAWSPSVVTGAYRTSNDVLLTDDNGESSLSAADLATAVLDEIEKPKHRRQRFHVAH